MKQREVTDKNSTKWSCVEAYSGMKAKLAEKASELTITDDAKTTVICTPTGGAKTVRLDLNQNWFEETNDEELINAIESNKD